LRQLTVELVRRTGGGNEQHLVEFGLLAALLGQDQMTQVNRIKRAAKDAQAHARTSATKCRSQSDGFQPLRDLLGRDQVAGARARTNSAGALPSRFGADVAFPERPGAALARANHIDRAALLAVVENAIAVALFPQRSATVADFGEASDELGARYADEP